MTNDYRKHALLAAKDRDSYEAVAKQTADVVYEALKELEGLALVPRLHHHGKTLLIKLPLNSSSTGTRVRNVKSLIRYLPLKRG